MRARAIGAAVLVILFASLAYLELSPEEKSSPQILPPFLPAVSSCVGLRPGMRRIGEPMKRIGDQTSFQFDVPAEDFTIFEGCTDAGPPICGFDIRPKNSTALMSISWGDYTPHQTGRSGMPPDPILGSGHASSELDLSAFVAKRRVLDDKGENIGQESWGYWGRGERWRRVHLVEWIQARYGSKNEGDVRSYGSVYQRDAALFDQIINSACRLVPTE